MAMQIGFSKILILIGAGSAGTILLQNGKLSDILGDLQGLIKSWDSSSAGDAEASVLATQLERLSREVQRMGSARPITVVSGGSSQSGNLTSLIVPAASLGAVGYGYMWWKGFSFSDLMYVTKRNMANAVSSMTKHLEQVSAALAATKRHLTQRIENLDGKLDEQKEISKDIRREVTGARDKLDLIGHDLNSLQELIWGLNGKVDTMEDKQNFLCTGVHYLCQFVSEKGGKVPAAFLQESPKTTKRGFLGHMETPTLKGLQHLTDVIESEKFGGVKSSADAISDKPKSFSRD